MAPPSIIVNPLAKVDLSEIKKSLKQPIKSTTENDHCTLQKKFLDLEKPLMPQMFANTWTKEFYLKEVHRARYLPRPAVMFPNTVLEMLTRTPWYVVPLIWLPMSGMFSWLAHLEISSRMVFWTYWMTGLLGWTLVEYLFHRFLFHIDKFLPDHRHSFTVHFLLHGFHHFLPMDRYRLVMPPMLMASLCIPWYFLILPNILPSIAHVRALFGGLWVGYVCYDMAHYHFHHAKPFIAHLRHMKRVHLAHHYGPAKSKEVSTTMMADNNSNKIETEVTSTAQFEGDVVGGFGVTSEFWDKRFGTKQQLFTPLS